MEHVQTFRWISVAVSILLGLGVSRILTGAVAQFHARGRREADFASLTWAAAIFLQQCYFWWSLEDLPEVVTRWTLGVFALLLGLALLLYLAAALILPSQEIDAGASLRTFFERDGRWGLPVLAGFNALAILANRLLLAEPLAAPEMGFNAALAALPLLGFAGPKWLRTPAALAYMLVMVAAIAILTAGVY